MKIFSLFYSAIEPVKIFSLFLPENDFFINTAAMPMNFYGPLALLLKSIHSSFVFSAA